LSMLVRHGELRTLEFMPALPLDLEVLNAIVAGNPHLTLLLLPRELVNEEMQKKLPYLPPIKSLIRLDLYSMGPTFEYISSLCLMISTFPGDNGCVPLICRLYFR
jgi:hypothetical protein